MCHDHAFGRRGRARGVLQECDGPGRERRLDPGIGIRPRVRLRRCEQRRRAPVADRCCGVDDGFGQQAGRTELAHDRGETLIGPARRQRRHRDGDRAGEETTECRDDIIHPMRQRDGKRRTGESARLQAGRESAHAATELPIGEPHAFLLAIAETDQRDGMRPLLAVAQQHIDNAVVER